MKDKVAIITGAGRGLGATIAAALAAVGARVAVNDINPDRAERVAAEIREQGGQALGIAADVANKYQCVHLIESTRVAWGRLDILVNNAAVQPVEPILKMDEWAWQRCLDVNLKGTFFMSQLVGRVMAEENRERGGVIINIGAAESYLPRTGQAAYLTSKAGVLGFTRQCAREYADFGVRVNMVFPAGGDTAVLAFPPTDRAALPEWLQDLLRGQAGTADDVAALVLALCDEAANDVTGKAIFTDGW